ncbi:MAG: GIY-YIG nuclease family protein [Bacteroidota bacterium]
MRQNYITYVLQSEIDKKFYEGFTQNLKNRIEEHNSGKVKSTKSRRPLIVIYYEVCYDKLDAVHREKYLKSAYGKRYIQNRLKNYLTG